MRNTNLIFNLVRIKHKGSHYSAALLLCLKVLYTESMAIDPNCIFCKIVADEIPAHIVYQDESFLAFLDINPRAPGHVQVIPREHHRWVWDLPAGRQVSPNIGAYFEIAQKIALAQRQAFNVDMIRSQVFGDEVPHAHVWLWPNIENDGREKDFEKNREAIKKYLV